MATLVTRVQDLATRISTECKSIRTLTNGNAVDNSALLTTAKANLVAAINELKTGLDGLAGSTQINDSTSGTTTTYSSSKIETRISAAIAALVNGAPAALDTLAELATQLGNDATALDNLMAAVGNRVRFDAPQTLSGPQIVQALANIGAAAVSHVHAIADVTGLQAALDAKIASSAIGNPDTDFVATFNTGLT